MKTQNQELRTKNSKSNLSAATSPSTSSGSKTMADLMQRVKTQFVSLSKGDLIKGKITKLTPSEILVDINAKTEAVVLEKDRKNLRNLLASLHLGDEVTVGVLNPESDNGHPVVSLRRFLGDASWEMLSKKQKSQEAIEATITEITKGGFIVETKFGVSGFLPNSQTQFMENSQDALGKKINVFVLELNRVDHKVILSQRAVMTPDEFKKRVAGFKTGQKTEAVVTTVTPFGLFAAVKMGNESIDGLIHISEIGWERTDDALDQFSVGQKLEAVVLRVDYDAKRVDLSLRRLTTDPFTQAAKNFAVDQKIKATVSKILSSGVILNIEGHSTLRDETSGSDSKSSLGLEAFIRKDKIPPTVSYDVGKVVDATVTEIDPKRRRIVVAPILKEKPIGYR